MKKTYLIFYYVHDGQDYVDAYPVHGLHLRYDTFLLPEMPRAYVVSNSRNQARKEAYKLWIDPSGRGFNKHPHPRSYAL